MDVLDPWPRRPGGGAVLTRLADLLVVHAIRSWLDTEPAARTGRPGALHDGRILTAGRSTATPPLRPAGGQPA